MVLKFVSGDLPETLLIISSPDPVPLVLSGEGHFSLTGVKEVKVSQEFAGLGEETTRCQTDQFRADCLTGKYLAKALHTCHCAPFYLISHYGTEVRHRLTSPPFCSF